MSKTQDLFNAGQAHGEGQEKAHNMMQPAADKAADLADHAQENKEQAAGFLQEAGGQMKQMASDAVDAVKNTMGVGDASKHN